MYIIIIESPVLYLITADMRLKKKMLYECTEIHWRLGSGGVEALSSWSMFEAADKTQGPIQPPDKSSFIPRDAHLGASDEGWAMWGRAPATWLVEVGKDRNSKIETFSCDFPNDRSKQHRPQPDISSAPPLLYFDYFLAFSR